MRSLLKINLSDIWYNFLYVDDYIRINMFYGDICAYFYYTPKMREK